METTIHAVPASIDWPVVSIGNARFTLRYSYASDYQLARWGKNLASADSLELAAAMAGSFTAPGEWRSAGFNRAIDLADQMLPEDEKPLIEAVAIAVKNRYPELELSRQTPGTEKPPEPENRTVSLSSGPSPSPLPDSLSPTSVSGA
jgi:hypothetical protein